MHVLAIDIIENDKNACVFRVTYKSSFFGIKREKIRVINRLDTCNHFLYAESGALRDEGSAQIKAFASLKNITEITSKSFYFKEG